MSRLVDQIKEALAAFAGSKKPPALIGGLALAVHQVVRATQDVDFLVDAEDGDRLHAALLALGYRCLHRSEDAANYQRGDEWLDLLYAHRPIARRLLDQAQACDTAMGSLHVISIEGLIAFKLQGYVNDPNRGRDLDDIRALLHTHAGALNMNEVREYSLCSIAENCSMRSSHKIPSHAAAHSPEPVLVREAGVPRHRANVNDPVAAWMDLMEAVEALCPRWPERLPSTASGDYRL